MSIHFSFNTIFGAKVDISPNITGIILDTFESSNPQCALVIENPISPGLKAKLFLKSFEDR